MTSFLMQYVGIITTGKEEWERIKRCTGGKLNTNFLVQFCSKNKGGLISGHFFLWSEPQKFVSMCTGRLLCEIQPHDISFSSLDFKSSILSADFLHLVLLKNFLRTVPNWKYIPRLSYLCFRTIIPLYGIRLHNTKFMTIPNFFFTLSQVQSKMIWIHPSQGITHLICEKACSDQ